MRCDAMICAIRVASPAATPPEHTRARTWRRVGRRHAEDARRKQHTRSLLVSFSFASALISCSICGAATARASCDWKMEIRVDKTVQNVQYDYNTTTCQLYSTRVHVRYSTRERAEHISLFLFDYSTQLDSILKAFFAG